MALAYLGDHTGYRLRKSKMNTDRGHDHQQYCYPHPHHAATVKVKGVSLTKVRPQFWQPATATRLMLEPASTVTVGKDDACTYT